MLGIPRYLGIPSILRQYFKAILKCLGMAHLCPYLIGTCTVYNNSSNFSIEKTIDTLSMNQYKYDILLHLYRAVTGTVPYVTCTVRYGTVPYYSQRHDVNVEED